MRSLSASLCSWPICIVAALFVFFLDAITKKLIFDFFPFSAPGIHIFSLLGVDFEITHATNTGAAWGFLSDTPSFLLGLRIFLIACLIGYLALFEVRPSFRMPLVLIVAGALGNIIDFFIYGHVVDMFHFTFWGYDYPVFNVADSAIFLGTIAILWIVLKEKEQKTT